MNMSETFMHVFVWVFISVDLQFGSIHLNTQADCEANCNETDCEAKLIKY